MSSVGGLLHRWQFKLLCVLLIVALSGIAFHYGIKLRRIAWDWSDGAHFQGDVSNAYRWGTRAHNHGLWAFYDNIDAGVFDMPGARNDYPPLRITIATKWREWCDRNYPHINTWQDDFDFTYPMLRLNIIAEALSSLLVFAIIIVWSRRCEKNRTWYTGLIPATLGMLATWFNPALIWDGHCWPQWDVWLVPFFLLAVLCYLFDFCTIAGISIAIGACMKGQILLAAPILLLLPLFTLRIGAVLRIATGFIFGMAAIVFLFMQPSQQAYNWFFCMILATAILFPVVMNWIKMRLWINLILLITALLIAWPWGAPPSIQGLEAFWRGFAPILILAVAASRYLPPNSRVHFYIATLGIAVFLFMPIFGMSDAWYRYGFAYGTEKFANMMTGTGTYNIPAMMREYYNWPNDSFDRVDVPLTNLQLTVTETSRYIYAILLIICGIGAAIHYKRKDPRFLVTMTIPWLLFYMILTQMHGRYPVWAAATAALLFGVNMGMGYLGIIVSIVAMLGIATNQLAFRRDWWPELTENLRAMHPHLGWILLLATLIYLYHALLPGRRNKSYHDSNDVRPVQ